jgi:hypothetical protein
MDRFLGRLLAAWTGLAIVALSAAAAEPQTAARDAAPAKYLLRYKFRPDDTLRWKVEQRFTVDATKSGVSQTAESVTVSIKVWKFRKVEPNGAATFEQFVENVDMWQKASGRAEARYNSQKDKTPPVGFEAVAKSIGVPLSRIAIDPQGTILARQYLRARPQGEQQGTVTIPMPETAVAVGETWTFPFDIDAPLGGGRIKRLKARQSFTLEDVKNGVATIRSGTEILTPIDDPAIEAKLAMRQPSGVVRFDIEAGRVVGQQMDTDKRVVGFSGESSVVHYRTRFTEEALGDAAAGAKATAKSEDKPATPAKLDKAAPAASTASEKKVDLPTAEKKPKAEAPQAAKPTTGSSEEGAAVKRDPDSPPQSASRPKPTESPSRK